MGSNPTTSSVKSREIRYAPYVESAHADLLSTAQTRTLAILDSSPYAEYTPPEVDDAFFSTGYLLSSFPPLYDMFGKNMAGVDIEVIWSRLFEDTLRADEIDSHILESIREQNDELDMSTIPSLSIAARKLNIVGSSTFVIGKAMIESAQVKRRAEVSAAIRFALLDEINGELSSYLNWQSAIVKRYAFNMKLYYETKAQGDGDQYHYLSEDALWALKALDFDRAVIGVLQRAKFVKEYATRERSKASKFLLMASDTATGASVGGQVGGWIGAIVGAVIGWQVGMTRVMIEDGNPMWWVGWVDPVAGNIIAMTS